MASQWQFREGYRGKAGDPEKIGSELFRLHEAGSLTATDVIDGARAKDSPLHDQFEWDDSIAGHKYRLVQARTMIRALVILPEIPGVVEPAFVHIPDVDQKEGKYVPYRAVIENVDEYERALQETQRRLESAERGFGELRRLAEKRGGKAEALAIAIQGFTAVKEAIGLLR